MDQFHVHDDQAEKAMEIVEAGAADAFIELGEREKTSDAIVQDSRQIKVANRKGRVDGISAPLPRRPFP